MCKLHYKNSSVKTAHSKHLKLETQQNHKTMSWVVLWTRGSWLNTPRLQGYLADLGVTLQSASQLHG